LAAILLCYGLDLRSAYLFFSWSTVVLISLRALLFIRFSTYSIIIRYLGEKDFKNIFLAVTLSSLAYFFSIQIFPSVLEPSKRLPVILVDYFLCLCLIVGVRVTLREAYDWMRRRVSGVSTAIFGAGEFGSLIEYVLRNNSSNTYRITAFLDDNQRVHRKLLNGIRVFNPEKSFQKAIKKYNIQNVIIGIRDLSPERKSSFINTCLAHNIKVLKIPPPEDWLNGTIYVDQLKNINLEDLLNRPAIQLNHEMVQNSIKGKVVLITGCAGSIGSEILRQLIHYNPKLIIGLDQAETPLAEITLELQKEFAHGLFLPIIGDVRDQSMMECIFQKYKPQYVFHAAAYKHVPIMECFPEAAIKTNVEGTQNMADLAVKYKVHKFVMISTDKVINPSNVMGASKRIAEIYVQSLNYHNNNRTQFITTRFGNVLGSNGSVVPIFRAQIEKREPITLTHPNVSRYFMTITEACQLVLEAGAMGRGGEIFIFDMGQPVFIADMANKMIKMAGLIPGKDVLIKITGLRPGEKLTEELLDNRENSISTHHPKIKKARVRVYNHNEVKIDVDILVHSANNGAERMTLVQKMKDMVPEFASQNSEFSALDNHQALNTQANITIIS